MYRLGLSLNLMSLGGLALAIGKLVDNSIVVLESIFRKREEGLDAGATPRAQGTATVAMAVTASTLTTVAVFFPLVFVEGLAGQLFRDQALTISFSQLASLVVALTLVPTLVRRSWRAGEAADAAPAAEASPRSAAGRGATCGWGAVRRCSSLPRLVARGGRRSGRRARGRWSIGCCGRSTPATARSSALSRGCCARALARPRRACSAGRGAGVRRRRSRVGLAAAAQSVPAVHRRASSASTCGCREGTALHVTDDDARRGSPPRCATIRASRFVYTSAGQIDLAAFAGSAREAEPRPDRGRA